MTGALFDLDVAAPYLLGAALSADVAFLVSTRTTPAEDSSMSRSAGRDG
jgi:hypothetical protein